MAAPFYEICFLFCFVKAADMVSKKLRF